MISEKIKVWLLALSGVEGGSDRVQVMPTENLANGDYSTNLALITKQDASLLKTELEKNLLPEIEKIEIAGAGFLNFFLKPEYFTKNLQKILDKKDKFGWNNNLEQKKIIVEYTDPNPFKEFHIGHLMSNAIGESISRLIEASGAEVKRACYQGDVGLHVAKAIWADGDYALGSKKYEESEEIKLEIQEINQKIYAKSDDELNKKYEAGKKLSLEKFAEMYQKLGTRFDYFFFESETGEFGKKIVEENMGNLPASGGVFEKSENAVVFKAENYDKKLHTRVFLNADGLPTYEAKELGLAKIKFEKFAYDQSIVITGNEINEYFKVLLQALKLIFPELAEKTKHLSHGMLRLSTRTDDNQGGPSKKMSSRTGDVITAENLITEVREKVLEKMRESDENPSADGAEQIAVGAIKYAILKQAPGRDVIFDFAKSLSFEGDSGPYLQYTYARARSVLAKSEQKADFNNLENIETARLLARFPEVVARAGENYSPQLLIQYLIQLASSFNAFYAQNKIIGSEEESSRLALTASVAQVIKNGLWLLGIEAPAEM